MYITISLIDKYDNKVVNIFRENNEKYLSKVEDPHKFKYLSEIEINDYSLFSPERMTDIIQELSKVKQDLTDFNEIKHVDDIIEIAERCKNMPDSGLLFAG